MRDSLQLRRDDASMNISVAGNSTRITIEKVARSHGNIGTTRTLKHHDNFTKPSTPYAHRRHHEAKDPRRMG